VVGGLTQAYTGQGPVTGTDRNAILMYHAVGEDPDAGYFGNVSTGQFRERIATLADHGDIVPLPAVVDSGSGQQFAVTFDDGLQSFYTEALPVLRAYEVPATVFVNPLFIDDRNADLARKRHDVDDPGRLMLADEQVRELVDSPLVTIGNHTLSHRKLSEVEDEGALRAEIVESKRLLEERYGITVDRFSYPHGVYTEQARRLVEATHELSVTAHPFLVARDEPHLLPRLGGHKPTERFQWERSGAGNMVNRCKRLVTDGDLRI